MEVQHLLSYSCCDFRCILSFVSSPLSLPQSRTHRFDLPDAGLIQPGSTPGMALSPHSTLPANFPPRDGSLSSNQSISSGNSLQSDSHDDERPGSTGDLSTGFIPRAATFNPNTPVTLRQRKTRSLALPSNTKMANLAQIYGSPKMFAAHANDVLTLDDFLAETEKTPNRVSLFMDCRACVCMQESVPVAIPRWWHWTSRDGPKRWPPQPM